VRFWWCAAVGAVPRLWSTRRSSIPPVLHVVLQDLPRPGLRLDAHAARGPAHPPRRRVAGSVRPARKSAEPLTWLDKPPRMWDKTFFRVLGTAQETEGRMRMAVWASLGAVRASLAELDTQIRTLHTPPR